MLTVNSNTIDTQAISQLFATEVKKEAAKMNAIKTTRQKMWDAPGHANEILTLVSNTTSVPVDDIKSKARDRHLVDARHIYFNILMCYSGVTITTKEAAAIINRDHATCLHSVKKCAELNETDIAFARKYAKCLENYRMTFSDGQHFVMEYNNHPQL